jgi:hypothetical protein
MKKVLIALVVLVFVGAGIAYYMYNKPVASLEHQTADVTVSADQLIQDYESDENTANEKYLGKIVEVSGKVSGVTQEEGKHKVSLETSNPMSAVICELEDHLKSGDLKSGDQIKMKGKCSGYLNDVILVQSSIVK